MSETPQHQQEELLRAWMDMAACIRGNRFLSTLSFNESFICNLLYRQHQEGLGGMTAAELCRRTRLLKSQMNHVLSGMERKGLICRTPSQRDRRSVLISLREEALPAYLAEHGAVLEIVSQVCGQLGSQQTEALSQLLRQAVAAVDQLKTNEENK